MTQKIMCFVSIELLTTLHLFLKCLLIRNFITEKRFSLFFTFHRLIDVGCVCFEQITITKPQKIGHKSKFSFDVHAGETEVGERER